MSRKDNVIAIVQARMDSSRFPGKMMARVCGQYLIDMVLARLNRLVKEGVLDKLVLATSIEKKDDPLVKHINNKWPEINVIRGSEEDVLSRFILALDQQPADIVVRVTGDCPFINNDALVDMLNSHRLANADITNYQPGFEYVDKGIEVISAPALYRIIKDKALTKEYREHVTAIMYRYQERYKVNYIASKKYLRRADVRLTVDTPKDIELIRHVCEGFDKDPVNLSIKEIIEYLDINSYLLLINQVSGRKSTLHESCRIGFRCDGNENIGMGNVVGSIRLAQLLAKHRGIGIEFLVRENAVVIKLIKNAGFSIEILPADIEAKNDVKCIIEKFTESDWSAVCINFCKVDIDRYCQLFKQINHANVPLIFMDNPVPPCYKHGDLILNALPHPDYTGYEPASTPDCYDGLEYLVLDESFYSADNERAERKNIERILVAMGGADSENVTGLVLEGLALTDFDGYVDIVIGVANSNKTILEASIKELELNGEINTNVSDMARRMCEADVGFSALGITSYEMAFMGLPVIFITGSAFNANVANEYIRKYQGAVSLGHYIDVTPDRISDLLTTQFGSFEFRKLKTAEQNKAVNENGAKRVLTIIDDFLKNTEAKSVHA